MNHHLKTWPEHYIFLENGRKNFSLRKNDRGFKDLDYCIEWEYIPDQKVFTGKSIIYQIHHVLDNSQHGLENNYCILSFPSCNKIHNVLDGPVKGDWEQLFWQIKKNGNRKDGEQAKKFYDELCKECSNFPFLKVTTELINQKEYKE